MAQISVAQERQRRLRLRKAELNMAGDHVSHLEARALRGRMHEIEPEALVHLYSRGSAKGCPEIGRIAELARVLLDPGDKLGEGLRRHARIGDEHQRRGHAADERDEIVERPFHVALCMRNDFRGRLRRQQDEISVGGLIGHVLRAHDAAPAGLVLEDHRAPQGPRHCSAIRRA